jgi:hypothetical protein
MAVQAVLKCANLSQGIGLRVNSKITGLGGIRKFPVKIAGVGDGIFIFLWAKTV